MPTLEQLKNNSAAGRDLLAFARDLIIFLALAMIIFYPPMLAQWLSYANIKSFAWGDLKVEAREGASKAAATAGTVEQLTELLKQINGTIAKDPALAAQMGPLRAQLEESVMLAKTANSEASAAAGIQHDALQKAAPEAVIKTGWVSTNFLSGPIATGATATVKGPLNLNIRSDPSSSSATLGILPPDTTVRVLEAPPGNWVKITTET